MEHSCAFWAKYWNPTSSVLKHKHCYPGSATGSHCGSCPMGSWPQQHRRESWRRARRHCRGSTSWGAASPFGVQSWVRTRSIQIAPRNCGLDDRGNSCWGPPHLENQLLVLNTKYAHWMLCYVAISYLLCTSLLLHNIACTENHRSHLDSWLAGCTGLCC